jgi:phage gp45-like
VTDFFDTLKSDRGIGAVAQPRIGVVTSSDPTTATAKVLLQPEGVLTGWLPVLTQWAGSSWGLSCPPSPGDQVLIIPQEGDAQHGVIIGRLFSNLVRPPMAASGEFTIRHQTGASIRLTNSGTIAIEGDLHVSGDVYDSHGSLGHLRNTYNIHIHYGANGSPTSLPITVD